MRVFLLFIFILVVEVKANVLFFDNFDGATLDTSKWDVVLPTGVASVSVQDGFLRSLNRGTVVTKQEFSGPFVVSGKFRTPAAFYDLTTITLRSSGSLPATPSHDRLEGLAIEIWSGGNYVTPWEIGATGATALAPSSPFGALTDNAIHTFEIQDTGSSFTVSINGTEIFSRATSFSAGAKISFSSRERTTAVGSQPELTGQSDLMEIQVIPEPSSISLFLAGGSALVAMRRRKVDDQV